MLARLLFRCADELQVQLDGCWYKQDWLPRSQAAEPQIVDPTRIHRFITIPIPNKPLRLLFQARLKARHNRTLSRCLLKIVGQQRRDLAHALHAGPCQSITAAQLTLGLLEVAPDAETLKALEISVVRASQELRDCYEDQLCLFPEGQRKLYDSLDLQALPQDQLLFELLLASKKADPRLSVSHFEDELLLEFSKDDDPEKVGVFIKAMRARGDRIQRSGALIRVRFSA